jgi:iron complex outermembrane receptor protein
MKLKRTLVALAVSAIFSNIHSPCAQAEESERVLAPVKTTPDKETDVQSRTELGKLTEATPISGTVVSQEEIEHLQLVNNLLELGKRVPGISMVRNMRIPDGGKLYTENRIDGMRAINTNTSVFDEVDMANVERIDVITGPASALYGSGALGGTISLYTRQAPRQPQAMLSQEFGSWGFQRTQGNAGASTEDGRFGFIVTSSNMDNDGWRKNNAAAEQNAAAEHKNGQAIKAFARLTDSTKLTLGYDQLHYDYRWAGTLAMSKFNRDWRQVEAGTFGQSIDDYKTTSLRLQQLVGERGEFTLAYGRITNDSTTNGSGGSGGGNNVICDDTGALAAPLAAGKTVKCRAVNNNSATSTNILSKTNNVAESTSAMYRQELDLAKSTLYAGVDMFETTADAASYNNVYNALQAQAGQWGQGTLYSAGTVKGTRETTPFLHFEVSPVDKLRLHLGERFGVVDYTVDDRTAANKDVNMTRKGNVLRSGVTYDLARNHIVWANWGETFNPQTTNSLVDSAVSGTPGRTIGAVLSPERGITKEVGFRGLFQELGLHYDVTYYNAETKGFNTTRTCSAAERTALNGGATCTLNEAAGQLATEGLESMFAWAATEWLDFGATYTNARAYFTDYVANGVNYAGKSYMAMPRQRLNLRVGVKPAPGWLVELEGDHISSYFLENTNTLGSYQRPDLFNLRASYRSKDWSFWLQALNLTNEQYATRVSITTIAGQSVQAASAGQGNSGTYTPLTLRAGISYKF